MRTQLKQEEAGSRKKENITTLTIPVAQAASSHTG